MLWVDAGATWTLGGLGNVIAQSERQRGGATVTGSLSVTAAASLNNATLSLSGGSFHDTAGRRPARAARRTGFGVATMGMAATSELQGGGSGDGVGRRAAIQAGGSIKPGRPTSSNRPWA